MKLRYLAVSALLMFVASFSSLTACDDVDKSLDCGHVCEQLKDCFGTNKDQCQTDCKKWADENKTNEGKLDDCAACIDDDKSCLENLGNCSGTCFFGSPPQQ